jgi:hypothetical protein
MEGISVFQLALLAILLAVYVVPAIVAVKRKKTNALAIAALNISLGWTVIGWAGALVWACTKDKRAA